MLITPYPLCAPRACLELLAESQRNQGERTVVEAHQAASPWPNRNRLITDQIADRGIGFWTLSGVSNWAHGNLP
jgi:hypothetical protein